MLTTQDVPGAPKWLDLGAPDTDAAAAFYTGLFDWQFQSAGPDAGGYGFFVLDGKAVAALGPLTEEGAASAWTPYFHTRDADATAKAVEQAGGTVRAAPFDVFEEGRMAQFTDPGGGRFAVWQPKKTNGLQAVNDPGTLCWTELHVADVLAARDFYGTVFSWQYEDMDMGEFTYTVLSPQDGGQEAMFGGIMPLIGDRSPLWLPYFEVADADAVVARAQELGGTVLAPAEDSEGIGRIAQLADPAGAAFAVITSASGS
ncbi:VOC family protein [Streptomyces sp. B1866]|uniref:VOC family protein n=1 Tax=Streptomyces sp. B1866 TaxID=3075431 RepID=UPI0028918927|nr:VOC family protein [Streptomyces sp. B1866]MDT3398612.1 VOC family protein [Streptomyces sp. B1866]